MIQNLIPDIFGFENGVLAPYSIEGGNVVIPPTLVASFPDEEAPTGTYYLFLESATSSDGSITLTLDDTGAITGTYDIIYSVYPDEEYNYDAGTILDVYYNPRRDVDNIKRCDFVETDFKGGLKYFLILSVIILAISALIMFT